jgi:hypothetical protein
VSRHVIPPLLIGIDKVTNSSSLDFVVPCNAMPEGLIYVKRDVQLSKRMKVFVVSVEMEAQAGTIPDGGEDVDSMPD